MKDDKTMALIAETADDKVHHSNYLLTYHLPQPVKFNLCWF